LINFFKNNFALFSFRHFLSSFFIFHAYLKCIRRTRGEMVSNIKMRNLFKSCWFLSFQKNFASKYCTVKVSLRPVVPLFLLTTIIPIFPCSPTLTNKIDHNTVIHTYDLLTSEHISDNDDFIISLNVYKPFSMRFSTNIWPQNHFVKTDLSFYFSFS
jgi:hypothetical protein